MKENVNQKLLVKFKSDLFKIGSKLDGSEQRNKEASYKLFIDYAFKSMLQALCLMEICGSKIYMKEHVSESLLNIEDSPELGQAVKSYCELVRACDPFIDVFSMLHEELLLTGRRGEGLGQFYTPSDLADGLAQLMPVLTAGKSINDICCGAGSLPLAALKRCAMTTPEALATVTVILNDIDELACKVAFLQVIANMLVHRVQIGNVLMYNCNVITDWSKDDTLMVGYKAPDIQPESSIKAGNVEAFNKVSAMCKSSSEPSTNPVMS
ncbi:N-6 DNA methylase [Pseudomonas sp. MF6747]|uniref:N-6 DNA methylase n=1 Tax=Pseudomonas sp. MF6747 TaxID=2797527 RepID=UPI00190B8F6F|nr:N-6 DNA methylase [Pseudomonas sp. MF6747]MBK3506746.1 N-6 DNA methylase [Pseudomonas sp. MF6747]